MTVPWEAFLQYLSMIIYETCEMTGVIAWSSTAIDNDCSLGRVLWNLPLVIYLPLVIFKTGKVTGLLPGAAQ